MMRYEETCLGQRLVLTGELLGEDLVLHCTGGHRPHVGAVCLAQPYEDDRGKRTACVSGVTAFRHRDADLGGLLAARCAKATGRTVCAVCGVHYDGLEPEQIKEVLAVCSNLCDRLLAGLRDLG